MPAKLNLKEVSFDVVLKLAERCNLACDYCYYYFHEYDANKNLPMMSPEVREELPRFLTRSIEELSIDRINIGLHGGEPLLMKKPIFDELCTSIREALQGKVTLGMGLQTNGVLVDEEWIDIFAKHQIRVGVSIDGPKEIHDRHRLDHAGRGSYDNAVRGLRMLQTAVKEGRIPSAGVLGVVPAKNGDKALEHLVYRLNVGTPNLNYPRGGWESQESLAWNRELESHRKMMQFYLDKLVYPSFHRIRGLAEILLTLQSDLGASINDRFASQRHYIATISSEGVIFPDDNLLAVEQSFAKKDLTIFGTSLKDFIESPAWQAIHEAVKTVPQECAECEWYRSCRSGDLFNRHSKSDGFSRKSALCDTIKVLHEETASFLVRKKLLPVEQLADRLSQPPTITADEMYRLITTKAAPAAATTAAADQPSE